MKKLTNKQIITISIVAVMILALTVAGIVIGAKRTKKNKEADKKVEAVEKDKTENKEKEEETEAEEIDKVKTVVEETGDAETTGNQTAQNDKQTSNQNNTGNKVITSKPSTGQSVTQPTPSHVHNWVEVKEQVAVPETGHYETIYEWKDYCNTCMTEITGWPSEARRQHYIDNGCENIMTSRREEVGQKWVVDTPATTESRVVAYKCSCGATREKTQYAGMYTLYDQASWDALERCKKLFRNGLAGEGSKFYETSANYGYWESVCVCNSSSNSAWMWIFIRDWKLDDYSYLQDSVREGIIDQAEADLVKALYEEIPSIFKGAIERVAPQGGTELYNYAVGLINQAGGNPDAVPSLAGAKGTIPENIPGLYVTIEETRGGFSLMFWAE